MSNMVMYRSNSDHNAVCCDILFHMKHNLGPLGPFLVTFRSLLTSSEVPKVPNFLLLARYIPNVAKRSI